jgi:hypothetical protein
VTVGVVDIFESVHIDDDQGAFALLALRAGQFPPDVRHERTSVRESRERIGKRIDFHLLE